MSQQNPNAPRLNPFSVMSTWLHAEPCEGATKRPNLRFTVIGNVPRITVRTNVPNDLQYGRIDFKTDLATFAAAMTYGQKLANGDDVPDERRFVYQDNFVAGKRLDKPMTLSTLVIGREQSSGRIYIAVLSSQQQRPRIRFFFGPSQFHNILNGDGTPLSPKDMSEAYAQGFLNAAYDVIKHMLVTEFDENARNVANPANFNSGGGNNNNSGGNNNYQRNNNNNNYQQNKPSGYSTPANTGFDDELPDFD